HEIKLVAENGVVKYVPDRIDAEVGDVVKFRFFAAAHSATQSTFDTPCTPLQHGFDTDLIPNPNNVESAEFERLFHVKDKKPTWFYCKQPNKNHCGQGMVFGINPNGKMDEFIQRAKDQNGALVDAPPPPTDTAPPPATATVVVSGGFNPDGSNNLQFTPPFLPTVKKGEKVVFDFRKLNHTLTESTFWNPCVKKFGTDIDTDFQNFNPDDVPLKTPATVEFTSDKPRFFYCKQANGTPNGHCSNGMVFAVNVNDYTFQAFQRNAQATLPRIKGRSPL
ncbi:hypothetical protein P152DRAFT_366688, partial [Eremomyces bilateralis CBS 781.70]